jgi:hypothetical protein
MTVPILFTRELKVSLQVLLDDPIQIGLLGTATGIAGGSTSPGGDDHGGAGCGEGIVG